MAMFVSKWTEISQVVFLCTELQLADGAYADYIAHSSVVIIRTFLFEIEMQMCGQFCTRIDASKQQKLFFPSTTDIPYKGLEYKCLQTARAAGCCGRAAWKHFAAHFAAATIERELKSRFWSVNAEKTVVRAESIDPNCLFSYTVTVHTPDSRCWFEVPRVPRLSCHSWRYSHSSCTEISGSPHGRAESLAVSIAILWCDLASIHADPDSTPRPAGKWNLGTDPWPPMVAYCSPFV